MPECKETRYMVEVRGCDATEDNLSGEIFWDESPEVWLGSLPYEYLEDAIQCIKSIAREQVIAWEKEAHTNGLELHIYEVEYVNDRPVSYEDTDCTGEWIGADLNGIWVGFEKVA